jgi:hypothetical protein
MPPKRKALALTDGNTEAIAPAANRTSKAATNADRGSKAVKKQTSNTATVTEKPAKPVARKFNYSNPETVRTQLFPWTYSTF